MGILSAAISSSVTSSKAKATPYNVEKALPCPTHLALLNSYLTTIGKDKEGNEFACSGIAMGKIALFFGPSQSGKTTMAIQVANAMAENIDAEVERQVTDIVILDFERSSQNISARVKSITGIDDETFDSRFTVIKGEFMTTEWLKKFIFDIVAAKKELKAADMIPWLDEKGEEIKIYPPTILIVDSIPSIRPQEVLDNPDLDNNMVGGALAKANSGLLVSIISLLESYNITILAINHTTKKIKTNMYVKEDGIFPGLPDDVNLPGGNKWGFYASYGFWLRPGAEMKEDADFYVAGRNVEVRILKSRSSSNTYRLKFALTAKQGFNDAITNYNYLKDNKYFAAASSRSSTLPGLEKYKLTARKFVELYYSDSEFQKAWDERVEEIYDQEVEQRNNPSLVAKSASVAKSKVTEEFEEE